MHVSWAHTYGTMVVCKFFLQGNCRFGSRCYNEHPTSGDHNYGYSGGRQQQSKPIWNQGGNNRFGALQQQNQGQSSSQANNANASPMELLQLIAEDAGLWARSKMWPFSCYRVKKDGPLIPGFEDLSPEELRMEAYTAQKNGTFQNYLQKVTGLASEYSTKQETLRQQGVETKQKLLQLIQDHEKQNSSATSTSIFGGQQQQASNSAFGGQTQNLFGKSQTASGSSLFGQASQQTTTTSVFGGQPANSGVFGQSQNQQNTFTNQPTSVFGGGQNQPETKGLFGKPATATTNQTSVFGQSSFGNQPQAGLFGKPAQQPQQPQQASTGLFGKPGNQFVATQGQGQGQGQSIFGGNQSQTSVFGGNSQPQQQQQSVFGTNQQPNQQASTASIFSQQSTNNTNNSIFGSSTPTTLFGKPVNQPASNPNANLFKPPQNQAAQPATQNQPNVSSQNVTAVNVTVTGTVYTQLNKLSQEDREQFEASKFSLGKIPMCPPPIELV